MGHARHPVQRSDPETVPGRLQAVAAEHGSLVALDDGRSALTYAELLEAAGRIGAALTEMVAFGDRVAIWAPNSTEWACASLGVLFAGATVVPVNTRYTAAEMGDIVGRAGCRVVFAEHEFLGRTLVDEVRSSGLEMPVVGLGPGHSDRRCTSWSDLLAAGRSGPTAARRLARLSPSDISHVQYTSGTTGRPKGAMLRHSAVVRTTAEWAAIVGLGPGDRYPVIAPFSHIGGHKTGLLACLAVGATAVPFATLDVDRLAGLIEAGGATILQGPPTMYQALIGRFRATPSASTPVAAAPSASARPRVAVTGGASVAPSLVRDIVEVLGVEHVFTAYGLTESTGVCTMTAPTDEVATVAETSGRPIPGVQVRIVDDRGGPVPLGVRGQIVVGGDGVMAGYLDDPEATADAVRDGWLQTGDIGWIGEDGCLRIVDRSKDLVIVGGLNAYPAEIERVLLEHPEVHQAAVIGVPDDRLGEVPVAFVVARAGRSIRGAELEEFCSRRLANFKRPRRYFLVPDLPVNAAGKVLKADLRQAAGSADPAAGA